VIGDLLEELGVVEILSFYLANRGEYSRLDGNEGFVC
jgi:hypothetical protein